MELIGKVSLYVLVIVLAASMIEAIWLSRKHKGTKKAFDWHEVWISLTDLVGRKLLAFVPLSLATPFFAFAWEHRIHTVTANTPLTVFLLFIGMEFCYYWYHRASHTVRFFWATHAVHHSPNQLTLSSAYRLGWTSKITGAALFFTPLVWLGLKPEVVLAALSINLLYQFWLHATWIPKLGWLEYVFNTPSAHRVHHASNAAYLDANFGGVLVIFDRLFGTYVEERADEPCRYGLTTPTTSHNPIVVQTEHWASLAKDVFRAKSVSQAIGFVLRPPGWLPDGEGETTEALQKRSQSGSKTIEAS
ncbi:Fatty acid hydroxylase [Burkholderia sp. 8Y]|uniref:sterol desaturase family protein n=1 Tax=Burkholderia sp. 8Y TaxID=2653133 RepID=UPI0012F2754E|nr:sterol desaturase family protein [Burkholderia sp. 8Y]VXC71243.1 Fatty acid hydroxylase [Burkholderia sp. 8Y]